MKNINPRNGTRRQVILRIADASTLEVACMIGNLALGEVSSWQVPGRRARTAVWHQPPSRIRTK
jgi:hypothetical protein